MKFIKNDYTFYKIVNEELPEYVYVGATCNFIRRKSEHKGTCNNPNQKKHNLKIYQTIRATGGWDKWKMVIIDKLDQSTLLEVRIKEEALRKEYNGNLNMVKAHTTTEERIETQKEYNQLNKKTIKEQRKAYRETNKDDIKERKKIYRENNQETLKEKAKLYHHTNQEAINEKKKCYYHENKEHLNEKKKEKMTCECGVIVRKNDLSRHKRSIKHQNYCETVETIDLNSK